MIDTLDGNVIGIACSKHYVLYPRQNLSLDRLRIDVNENNKVFIALKLLKRWRSSAHCHVSMIFTLVDMLFAYSKMSAGNFASPKDRSTFERIG